MTTCGSERVARSPKARRAHTRSVGRGRGCRLTRGMHVVARQWKRWGERYGRTLPQLLQVEEPISNFTRIAADGGGHNPALRAGP